MKIDLGAFALMFYEGGGTLWSAMLHDGLPIGLWFLIPYGLLTYVGQTRLKPAQAKFLIFLSRVSLVAALAADIVRWFQS